jgi:hypothetical protein
MNTLSKASMLLTFLCMAISSALYAQTTIPNGDFESWENVGSSTEEPMNWSGNKTASQFSAISPQTCFREGSNPHSGTYCLKLDNASFFGNDINASATTGRIMAPSTDPVDGYINTIMASPEFNAPFTGRPDSIVTWYKFTKGGSDVARITCILHDSFDVSEPDQGGSASHIIGQGSIDISTTIAGWTRIAFPIIYNNANMPAYILLISTASNVAGSANSNTILWLDDMTAIYNVSTGTDYINTAFNSEVNIYPNPSQGITTLDLGADYNDVSVIITDLAGRTVLENNNLSGQKFELNLDRPAGVYIVTVASEGKHAVMKLIKQ